MKVSLDIVFHTAAEPVDYLTEALALMISDKYLLVSFVNGTVCEYCIEVSPYNVLTDSPQVTLIYFTVRGIMYVQNSLFVFKCKGNSDLKAFLDALNTGVFCNYPVSLSVYHFLKK